MLKRFARLLNAITIAMLIIIGHPLQAQTETKKQDTGELLKQGVITEEQKNWLDQKTDKDKFFRDRLANYNPDSKLTEGQIALQLQIQNEAPDMLCMTNTGKLAVAIIDEEVPPFVFTNKKGELDGIDIQIVKEIAKELEVEPVFIKASSYNAVLDLVIEKKVNMAISKLSITSNRSKKIRFAGSYVKLSKSLQINRMKLKELNKNKNLTLMELFNSPETKIGVLENSAYENYARTIFPKASVASFKSWDEAVDAMKNGEILAVFRDEWETRKTILNDPKLAIFSEIITINDQDDPLQMAVPWSSPQFAHYLDNFILVNSKFQYNLDKLTEAYKKYKRENQ